MEDRELEVRAKLDQLPHTFRFEALLEDCHDLPMFIATFLAVLDLARQHTLVFTVDENDVIWFSRGTGMHIRLSEERLKNEDKRLERYEMRNGTGRSRKKIPEETTLCWTIRCR